MFSLTILDESLRHNNCYGRAKKGMLYSENIFEGKKKTELTMSPYAL